MFAERDKYHLELGNDGHYRFSVHYDTTKQGFEDAIENSTFSERLKTGQAYAELSHPIFDDHQDPRVILARQKQIDPRRIMGKITLEQNNAEGFRCRLEPHGHFGSALLSACHYYVAPRMLFDEDENVVNIITFDFVQ